MLSVIVKGLGIAAIGPLVVMELISIFGIYKSGKLESFDWSSLWTFKKKDKAKESEDPEVIGEETKDWSSGKYDDELMLDP